MKTRCHQSFFSYSISKSYPFRWFTPIVVVVFVTFAVVFSIVNFVSNGFILTSELTANPNTTLDENQWLQSWPLFLTSKSQAICQPLNLPVNSKISTNQSALTYTLTNVWRPGAGQHVAEIIAPSLSYYNNVLENCGIWNIEVDLEAMDRSGNQFAYTEWGATVRSYISCSIQGSNGTLKFNMTQDYDYVPSSVTFSTLYVFLGSGFINRDKHFRASLWWGDSLLSTYWALLTMRMQQIRQNDSISSDPSIRKGSIIFTPNNAFGMDITSQDFFRVDYRFLIETIPPGTFNVVYPG